MGELGALFNPGMRHELEERQAKAARREEEGNANDGDVRIDLESGVAVIKSQGQQDSSGDATQNQERAGTAAPAVDSAVAPDASVERSATRSKARIRDDVEATPGARAAARSSSAAAAGPVVRPRGKRGASAGR